MRFWADKNNIAKHLVRAIKTGKGAVGHGTGLRNELDSIVTVDQDTLINITRYRIRDTYKNSDGKVQAVYSNPYSIDTLIKKHQSKNLQKFLDREESKLQKQIYEILQKK